MATSFSYSDVMFIQEKEYLELETVTCLGVSDFGQIIRHTQQLIMLLVLHVF